MRKRSRSDASGHRASSPQVSGVIWYPGGPIDRGSHDRIDLTLNPLAKEVRLSKISQTASLENI